MQLANGAEYLRQQLAQKEAEAEQVTQEVMALKQAIAILEGVSVDDLPQQISMEYRDLGITAATKRFLREMGEPQDTRTIADGLIKRGLESQSKNWIATVYATLNNGKQWFVRTKDNRWALKDDGNK